MGVYIKGMEMPTNCLGCRFLELSPEHGDFCVLTKQVHFRFKNRPNDCPLVPVPDHGRLIDADALKTMWDDEIARLLEKGIEYLDYHVSTLFSDFKNDADKMPTIIPADGGAE